MTTETFKEILNEKSFTFTTKELMEIIDEELERPPEKMDLSLIDACLNVLERDGII